MSTTTIFNLNDDCIACIFKYLPFDNHLNLANVCTRFRYVWQSYRQFLYKRLELGATTSDGFKQEMLLFRLVNGNVKHIILNLHRHFKWDEAFVTEIISVLATMTNLERVILWIKDKERFEVFESFLRALEHLPNIKGITAYQDNDVVDSLYQFSVFEDLLMESKMSRNPLMESIHLHTKIRILIFRNASVKPTLKDLVAHSTSIKELSFRMTQKAVEYTPIADLLELTKLQIFGNRMDQNYGPLMPLVSAISSKLSHQLQTLTIHAPGLGYLETMEIARIRTLKRLDCYFSEPRCLELLKDMDNLRDIFIELPNSSPIDNFVLILLENCPKLSVLQIDAPNLASNFILRAFEVLRRVRNPRTQRPLILMFADTVVTLDKEMSKYLKVFWRDKLDLSNTIL